MNLAVETKMEGDSACIGVQGEVDVSNADVLREEVDKALSDAGVARITVDMGGVPYIDSTGIGVLVGTAHKAVDVGKGFSVLDPQPNVVRILGLLGVDQALELRTSE